ncbi:MAG: thiamine pyrophosphate-binding protein [Alphaproteobacteria bacterium]
MENKNVMARGNDNSSDVGAEVIAKILLSLGIERVYGLQGGHIQPIWDAITRFGGIMVDARDERAAVHMAHGEAEVTGKIGVALVTAGPGVTNAVTAIANADKARAPVLVIGGAVPRPQAGSGALQEFPQIDLMRPITRAAVSIWNARRLSFELHAVLSRAAGEGGVPGPVFF